MNHLLNVVIPTYSFVKLPKANDEYNASVFRANVGWFLNFGQACDWQFGQLCDKPQNTSSTLDGTHAPIFGKILDSKKRKSEHHQSLDIFHLWNIYLYGRSLRCMIEYWVTYTIPGFDQVQGAKKMLRRATVAQRDLGQPTLQ